MRLVGQARGPAGPGDLFQGQAVAGVVSSGSTVFLSDRQAHEAEAGHLPEDVEGEGSRPVDLLGLGRNLALGEVPGGIADELLIFRQLEVHFGSRFSRKAPQPSQGSSVEKTTA